MNEKKIIPMKFSGFCRWPGVDDDGHEFCVKAGCPCQCHRKPEEAGDNAEDK